MHRVGVDFITITGSAPQDSVLILNHRDGRVSARLEPINPDGSMGAGYAAQDGEWLSGFFALQQAIYDRYHQEFEAHWVKSICGRSGCTHNEYGHYRQQPGEKR